MFLTRVSQLHLDLDVVTDFYTHILNLSSISWFWRCKEHPCPLSPHLGLWRTLEVLTGVLHLDHDLDVVTGLLFIHVPNFCSLSWFSRCKEHLCPLSPNLGLWKTLEVPDWGLASCSWFAYGHLSLIDPWSEFCKNHPCPLSPYLGLWKTLEVPDWGLESWFWFRYGQWSVIHPLSKF